MRLGYQITKVDNLKTWTWLLYLLGKQRIHSYHLLNFTFGRQSLLVTPLPGGAGGSDREEPSVGLLHLLPGAALLVRPHHPAPV